MISALIVALLLHIKKENAAEMRNLCGSRGIQFWARVPVEFVRLPLVLQNGHPLLLYGQPKLCVMLSPAKWEFSKGKLLYGALPDSPHS
jgi:hypothetical protein